MQVSQRWSVIAIVTGTITGCAGVQATPEQEATWAAMRACDRFVGVTPERVDAHGRYWFTYTSASSAGEFQTCVARERARAAGEKYALASPAERVYQAYFVSAVPPADGVLTEPPVKEAIFERSAPVLFYYNVWNTGRPTHASFSWYAPDGSLVAQHERTLEDNANTDRTWYVERLPVARAPEPGDWALVFAIDGQLVARYSFAVVP